MAFNDVPPRNAVIKYLIILFCLGAGVGFFSMSYFLDILLQPQVTRIAITSISLSELVFTRVGFSLYSAVAFASIPLSGLIACKFSRKEHYKLWILVFTVVVFVSIVTLTLYYRHYFVLMSSAIDMSEFSPAFDVPGSPGLINIAISKLPLYKIPLFASAINVALALFVATTRKLRAAI